MVPWKIANYVVGDEEHSNNLTLTNAFVNIVVVFETYIVSPAVWSERKILLLCN